MGDVIEPTVDPGKTTPQPHAFMVTIRSQALVFEPSTPPNEMESSLVAPIQKRPQYHLKHHLVSCDKSHDHRQTQIEKVS